MVESSFLKVAKAVVAATAATLGALATGAVGDEHIQLSEALFAAATGLGAFAAVWATPNKTSSSQSSSG